MLLALMVTVVAQAAPVDPSLYTQLGPAGAVAAVLGAWVWWLTKDRARIIADRDAERVAKDAVKDQLVEQSREIIPVASHLADITEGIEALLIRAKDPR